MTADGGEAHGQASKQMVKPGDPRPYRLSRVTGRSARPWHRALQAMAVTVWP